MKRETVSIVLLFVFIALLTINVIVESVHFYYGEKQRQELIDLNKKQLELLQKK